MTSPSRTAPSSFLKHAADVASFYGFRPAGELMPKARLVMPNLERVRSHTFTSVSTVCVACATTEPALAFWASPSPAHLPPGKGGDIKNELGEFGLHIAGTPESLGEIMLLKTLSTIITEWGATLRAVRLNALGDRDSKARYARELSYYFRKHQDELCPECRARITTEPTAPFSCLHEQCRAVASTAPRAMNFLSEKSRAHFREVLEHIEGLGFPYELDDLLVSSERESQILFSVDLGEDATLEGAFGGRFDDHVRKLTSRKDATGVSASVFFHKKGLSASNFSTRAPIRTPKVFFVQLGLKAKLQGLSVLDELRAARVPVLQSFEAGKLSPQLDAAKKAGVSHLIIMGQREVLDGTVIVREVNNSSQTTVQLRALPRFLKTLR